MIGPSTVVELEDAATFSVALKLELLDAEVSFRICPVYHRNLVLATEDASLCGWPVFVCLRSTVFDQASEHNDDMDLLLPHHAPEVAKGVGERCLRADVDRIASAAHKVRIDVVAVARLSGRKMNSGGVD